MIAVQPTAGGVLQNIPPFRTGDSALAVLERLRDIGVAVLVDDDNRPFDILTSKDVEVVRSRTHNLGPDSRASSLFASTRRYLHVVKVSDDVRAISRVVAANNLVPGVVAVDDNGRYAGYVFNEDLQKKVETFFNEAVEQVERVKQAYPAAWSAVGERITSSVK